MKKLLIILLGLIFILLIIVNIFKPKNESKKLFVNGRIEADIIDISSKIPGEIIKVYYKEGDYVKRGDLLAEVDRRELLEKLKQLTSQKKQIENLIKIKLKEIESLKIKLEQIKLKKEKIAKELKIAKEIAENNITIAKRKFDIINNQLSVTEKQLEKIKTDLSRYQKLFKEGGISKSKFEEISLKFDEIDKKHKSLLKEKDVAFTNYQIAKKNLENVILQENDIQILDKEISNLETTISAKEFDLDITKNKLNEINYIISQLKIKINDTYITSPISGVIMSKSIDEGEIATNLTTIFSIYDPEKIYFKGYFPEKYLSKIKIGDEAEVFIDGENKPFKAKISYISSKAEFTPKEIQSKDERVKQVFAVKAYFETPTKFLKPGMPADLIINLEK
ncbi:efflux RND transporter periplasmic adaptor subunit [Deferribacter thermophilus]|uniref:HlyD family secretion protein n=1 Tax=Deferribacter thermophilus TaxID=53573 RepID=UPI003C17CEF0